MAFLVGSGSVFLIVAIPLGSFLSAAARSGLLLCLAGTRGGSWRRSHQRWPTSIRTRTSTRAGVRVERRALRVSGAGHQAWIVWIGSHTSRIPTHVLTGRTSLCQVALRPQSRVAGWGWRLHGQRAHTGLQVPRGHRRHVRIGTASCSGSRSLLGSWCRPGAALWLFLFLRGGSLAWPTTSSRGRSLAKSFLPCDHHLALALVQRLVRHDALVHYQQ